MKLTTLTRDPETGYLNPVCYDEDSSKWYFYEETWSHLQGPYETEERANEMLDLYCIEVLGCDVADV